MYNSYEKYGIQWWGILQKWGVYILGGYIWRDILSQREICKMLKGGYIVVRDNKKHELTRGPLIVRMLSIDYKGVIHCVNNEASRIEFWTADRRLVYWTDL